MDRVDVCLCEPFILPGILPTLGVATIKSELKAAGLNCRIVYPSINYFTQKRLYEKRFILSLVEDTPLQLVEYLFVSDERENSAIRYISQAICDDKHFEGADGLLDVLKQLHKSAIELVDGLVETIVSYNPKVFCFSTTFGDMNFDLCFIEKLKQKAPDIKIICGGSNCNPEYSARLMRMSTCLDAIICDETGFVTVEYVRSVCRKNDITENFARYITTTENTASDIFPLLSIDELPAPEFDDFIAEANKLGIDTSLLTLPYELARGCWWGEMHPCSMCGFFGSQKNYIVKNPEKAIREIADMLNKYGIEQIRFSDLVNPQIDLVEELLPLKDYHARFFWELRPDLTEPHIAMLRKIGMTCGQIGIESFSSPELCTIRKGTSGIANVHVLRMLSEYKIEVMWNYLYGFTNDKAEWYESVLQVIPSLYHLQPPGARKIWINRFSELYNESDKDALVPLGDDAFHDYESCEFNYFFKVAEKPEMKPIYAALLEEIDKWRNAYKEHFSLLAVPQENNELLIERRYGEEQTDIMLESTKAFIYCFFREPHTEDDFTALYGNKELLASILQEFVGQRIMISLDHSYLSTACFPSEYKWTPFYKQPSYAGGMIFKERGKKNAV